MANEGIMAAPVAMQQPQGYVSSLDAYNAAASAMQETDPQAFDQYKTEIASRMSGLNLTPSQIETFITLLEYMLQYPDQYKEIIRAGIEAGAIEEGDFPPEFDQGFVSTLLAALNEQRIQRAQNVAPEAMAPGPQEPMAMKSGGLADAAKALQAKGRGKDTILAHITPQEAEMLRKAGGLGTINPYTGLREYGWLKDAWNGVKSAVKDTVNVVKDVVKSPLGQIAVTIGATMLLGPIAAGFGIGTAGTAAIVGGGMAALKGGNVQDILKGAALGYLGGTIAPAVSGYLPGAAGSVLNQGLTGALMGTGFGLAQGMSFKDALKAGAIGGLTGAGVAYGQQQGYLPGGAGAGKTEPAPVEDRSTGLSLAPVEATGPIGTATENLSLSSTDPYSPYYKGEPTAPVDNFTITDAQNRMITSAPDYAPNLSAQSQYLMKTPTDYSLGTASDYTTSPSGSMDARQTLLNKTYGDFQNTVPINSSYVAQDPSLVSDYSLEARPAPAPGQVASSRTGVGIRPTQPVSLSGGYNPPEGGLGLGPGTAGPPGLVLPAQARYGTASDFVPTETGTGMQQGNLVGSSQTPNSFIEGAKSLYNRASDAVVGGYDEYLSPNRPSIQQGYSDAAIKADQAVEDYYRNSPRPTAEGAAAVRQQVYDANAPGFISKYAPMAGAALGATYLMGGFDKPPANDKPVYDPAYTGTSYMRDNPQLFSGSLYNYQSQGAGAYNPYRETRYAGELGAATRGVVTPTGIMQAEYSPYYGRRVRQQQYYSPFIGTSEPVMAAKGGSIQEYPRKTGPISGPGTGTSDDIPAMLSDGEFVFTAKAVRNAGGGSRRKGAARMYKLMKSLEKGGMVKG